MSYKSYLSYFASVLFWALVLVLNVHAQDDSSDAPKSSGPAPTKPVGRMITLGDFGAEDLAYLSVPVTPPTLGIVLIPDAYGLDDFTKAEADRLAGLGYLTIAIDIYNGRLTTDPGELANLTANLDSALVMKTVDAGVRFFHESPKFRTGHVVVMGWGAGATYAFQSARENKMVDGAITFYGPLELPVGSEVGKFAAPLCAVYPANDPVATHDNVVAFQDTMKANGNDYEAWFIDAGRGWSNPKSKSYNATEDREAWKVALPFLVRIGALPVKTHDPSILDKAKNGIEKIFQ